MSDDLAYLGLAEAAELIRDEEIVAGRVRDGAAGPDRAPRPQTQRFHRVDAGAGTDCGAGGRG